MMGLLGNVAEVKDLRHRLMKTEFIVVFANLLESASDGIEVNSVNRVVLTIGFNAFTNRPLG